MSDVRTKHFVTDMVFVMRYFFKLKTHVNRKKYCDCYDGYVGQYCQIELCVFDSDTLYLGFYFF